MERTKRSVLLEWTVYGLALVSLTTLVYLFSTRNSTSILLENSKNEAMNILPMAESNIIANNTNTESELTDDILSEPTPNQNIESKTQDIISNKVQEKPMPVVESITKNKNSSKVVNQNNIVKTPKKKPVVKTPKKQKPKNISKKCSCSCQKNTKIQSKSRNKTTNISGFTKFKKPIYVPYKQYNWTILKRYPEKPNKKLYKTGRYKVKSGENIYTIARKFKVKPINIMAINKLKNPDILIYGNKIFIPNR